MSVRSPAFHRDEAIDITTSNHDNDNILSTAKKTWLVKLVVHWDYFVKKNRLDTHTNFVN